MFGVLDEALKGVHSWHVVQGETLLDVGAKAVQIVPLYCA
jgi:hypothetical protein